MRPLVEPTSDKDARQQLGDFIQRARVQRERSHRDVAVMCGTNVDVVKSWERGATVPNGTQWVRLKGMLNGLSAAALIWRAALAAQEAASVKLPPPGSAEIQNTARMRVIDERVAHEVRIEETQSEIPDQNAEPPPKLDDPRVARSFGAALRIVRLQEGLTQEEVGELVGCVSTAVGAWESDDVAPVQDNLRRIYEIMPVLRECKQPASRAIPKPIGALGYQREDRLGQLTNIHPIHPISNDQKIVETRFVSTPAPKLSPLEQAGVDYAKALQHLAQERIKLRKAEEALKIIRDEVDELSREVDIALDALNRAVGS